MIPAANLTRQFTWSRIFKHNSEEWESSMVHYHNPRNRKNLLLVHLQSPSVQFLVEQWPRNLGTSIMSWMPLNIKNMAGRTFANWTHAQALLCIRSRCCWLCFFRTFWPHWQMVVSRPRQKNALYQHKLKQYESIKTWISARPASISTCLLSCSAGSLFTFTLLSQLRRKMP